MLSRLFIRQRLPQYVGFTTIGCNYFVNFFPVKTSEYNFQFEPCSASEVQEFSALYEIQVDLLELVVLTCFCFFAGDALS